jgi:hypothetical protein
MKINEFKQNETTRLKPSRFSPKFPEISEEKLDEGPCDVAEKSDIEKMTSKQYVKYTNWKKECEAAESRNSTADDEAELDKMFDGKSPHKKGTKKYNKHMAAVHAGESTRVDELGRMEFIFDKDEWSEEELESLASMDGAEWDVEAGTITASGHRPATLKVLNRLAHVMPGVERGETSEIPKDQGRNVPDALKAMGMKHTPMSMDQAPGKYIATKMAKDDTMKGWADKVAKIKMVSRDDLEKMLPDYVAGSDITALFDSVQEESSPAPDGPNYQQGDLVVINGRSYVLDEYEDGIWWATDDDGGDIEFTPGDEDHHEAMGEDSPDNEDWENDVTRTLRKIVDEHQAQKVKFDNGKKTTVDAFTASAVVQGLDALRPDLQVKAADFINQSPGHLVRFSEMVFGSQKEGYGESVDPVGLSLNVMREAFAEYEGDASSRWNKYANYRGLRQKMAHVAKRVEVKEGKMKELDFDLNDKEMSAEDFKKKYGKSRAEMKKTLDT